MVRRIALAVSLVIGLPMGAHAATLYTPFLIVAAGDALNCGVVNASTKPVEVTLEVLSISGAVLAGGSPITLGPGVGGGQTVQGGEFPSHCRFTVKKAKAIRGRACVLTTGASCFAAVPAQ